jgi:hypothetical protein
MGIELSALGEGPESKEGEGRCSVELVSFSALMASIPLIHSLNDI